MARKRKATDNDYPVDGNYTLLKIVKQNGKLLDVKMAPHHAPFANLCAALTEGGLFVFDTDALGEGHFDLLSHLSCTAHSLEWLITPNGDDAIVMLRGKDLWLVSLACSQVLAKIEMGETDTMQVREGVICIQGPDGLRLFDCHGIKVVGDAPSETEDDTLYFHEHVPRLPEGQTLKVNAKITTVFNDDTLTLIGLQNGQVCILQDDKVTLLKHPRRQSPIIRLLSFAESRILVGDLEGTLWLYKKSNIPVVGR
ncbi:hypothetical protein PSACC_03312 [Paramicrosporidium saccamoebae]|uniref:Uncharacterized protein n=1 Tax=Paramicrosporidium saccamoebae TaxID=1246581 RepID=A0A2H9TGQ6_9FUNG|nr:hypothetical protein PSACC_03312 [Paramicrosporidium saccamoebae]